ncbi:uncharacterized protein LOC110860646 [Folsomia candida]|uniref:uncharacterized protein LOC110860646 n=1 Tax=Folsomia candida TaxID=158441 RepID=UPI000B8FE3DB|nr:uncharacterized protein LOC110860646 [Folsomia candida]
MDKIEVNQDGRQSSKESSNERAQELLKEYRELCEKNASLVADNTRLHQEKDMWQKAIKDTEPAYKEHIENLRNTIEMERNRVADLYKAFRLYIPYLFAWTTQNYPGDLHNMNDYQVIFPPVLYPDLIDKGHQEFMLVRRIAKEGEELGSSPE